jgi:HNH endonuclease
MSVPSAFHAAPFQIDHIIARQHGGKTELENLALACIHCNRFKGPNVAGLDPESREIVRLFHPRRDSWADHFVWDGPELKARTQMGRVTIAVLVINDPEVVAVRKRYKTREFCGASDPNRASVPNSLTRC